MSTDPYQRRFLTTREAARRLNCSASHLNKSRVRGDGPPFIRIGTAVRYDPEDLDEYAASRRVRSTSEAAR
jgi:excisionase family DNA binding protein